MSSPDSSVELCAREWDTIVQYTPDACRQAVADCVQEHASTLAEFFYEHLLEHPQAQRFLHQEAVHARLLASMTRWLQELFAHPQAPIAQQIATQQRVGEAHARIGLPVHLTLRGARVLKICLHNLLQEQMGSRSQLLLALAYSSQLIDIALELMCSGSVSGAVQNSAADDEHYNRLQAHQLALVHARQHAHLLAWNQTVLLALHQPPSAKPLPRLARSEFGLWFANKAAPRYAGAAEIERIGEHIADIDATLALLPAPAQTPVSQAHLLSELQARMDDIVVQLGALFGRQIGQDKDGDSLSHLLSQRIPPSALAPQTAPFAALLISLDPFQPDAQPDEPQARDLLLQQATALIQRCVRGADTVLRYGDEALMVMLEQIALGSARELAERIRASFEAHDFLLGDGLPTQVTVRVGLAMFEDRPDYQQLIERADRAMQLAPQAGGNRICEF